MCDAANSVSRLTRDFNDVRKKFTYISSIININFFIYYVTLIHFRFDNYYVKIHIYLCKLNAAAKLATSLLVYKQQLSRFTISARCVSKMVIILRMKQHEILEKTPLWYKFYECLDEISWT